MSLVRLGGRGDRNLVILHATGFLSAAYQPLADALSKSFVVWGLDLPGHGTAAGTQPPATTSSSSSSSNSCIPITVPDVTQSVIDAVTQAGLAGCYAFGHSAGGALALLASSQCPQLFKALYCFEAVASTPDTHAFMAAATSSGAIATDGQVLGRMARKRRAVFGSRAAALQHLSAKPPFAGLHPQALALYVQHGFVEQQQQQGAVQLSSTTNSQQGGSTQPASPDQQYQQQQQQQEQRPVQLVCSPEQEAAYFDALQSPPAVDPRSIRCPVLMAVAAPPAGSGAPPAAELATHAAVSAWFRQRSSGSSGGSKQLHGELRVLNIELAAALPTATLLEVAGVTHFGPLEQPQLLADSCLDFFLGQQQQQQQQQQHGVLSSRL